MKLRNKETGAIYSIEDIDLGTNQIPSWLGFTKYTSLAKLCEEWEDYEEPKTEFYITSWGDIREYTTEEERFAFKQKLEIGNYFETEEEAERAVEKLKAWKRLKDKGAEFYGWRRNQTGTYELYMRWEDRIPRSYEVKKDLDLLFGGEE